MDNKDRINNITSDNLKIRYQEMVNIYKETAEALGSALEMQKKICEVVDLELGETKNFLSEIIALLKSNQYINANQEVINIIKRYEERYLK